MPIHITIELNDRVIERLHIARISNSSSRAPGRVHQYSILKQEHAPTNDAGWEAGTHFTHQYGDGLETCIRKGLEALENEPKLDSE